MLFRTYRSVVYASDAISSSVEVLLSLLLLLQGLKLKFLDTSGKLHVFSSLFRFSLLCFYFFFRFVSFAEKLVIIMKILRICNVVSRLLFLNICVCVCSFMFLFFLEVCLAIIRIILCAAENCVPDI